MIIVEFTQKEIQKLFSFRGSGGKVLALKSGNEFLDFEFKEFTLGPLKKGKISLTLFPKVVGTFRVLAVFFRVFNIPRFFTFDNEFNSMEHFIFYVHELEGIEANSKSLSLTGNEKRFINPLTRTVNLRNTGTNSGHQLVCGA